MKKVLILAYDFPPYVSVGGLRPNCWYKYFHEFGIHPIVVTRQWNNKYGNHLDYIAPSEAAIDIIDENDTGTVIRTAYSPNLANKIMLKYGETKYRLIRKIISGYFEFAQYIFNVGPKSKLYFAAKKYLTENKVDAIIATGDPFILFRYASNLSAKFNVPWIADYRDIWAQNKHIQNVFFLKKWHTYFEFKAVSTSYCITTVSTFLKSNITTLIKNKEVFILPNGYDPDAINDVKDVKQENELLQIALVGSIYNWNPIEVFFETIQKFIESNHSPKLRINFYGVNLYGFNNYDSLQEMIKDKYPKLLDYVVIYKKTPNNILLRELSKQNLMLLFNYYSYMGTKIFDYIGLKRSILFCFENDEVANELKEKFYDIEEIDGFSSSLQADLIRDTQSGYVIQNSKHLLEKLHELYQEFLSNGFIKCDTINSEKYSRKNQVEELSDIVKAISVTGK